MNGMLYFQNQRSAILVLSRLVEYLTHMQKVQVLSLEFYCTLHSVQENASMALFPNRDHGPHHSCSFPLYTFL